MNQKLYKRKGEHKVLQETWGSVPLLRFPSLTETRLVKHCFTTRMGGVSEGMFESLNLSFIRGDQEESVKENFKRVAKEMGVEEDHYIFTDQTHTTHVKVVSEKEQGMGFNKARDYKDVDGLVTNVPGLVLSTFYADCVPLYFLDPIKKVIGLSHSGWRGTVGRIGAETVAVMQQEFGCEPKDILAAIGPSICMDCYEISEDVALEFQREFNKEGQEDILLKKENKKYQLDLWRANEYVLLEAGILPEHLETTDICTCCNSTLLFSHRASHGKRGNLGAFLSLC